MFEQERGRIYQRDGDCRGWWDQPARYLKDQGYDFPDRYEQQEDQERQAVGDQPFAVIALRNAIIRRYSPAVPEVAGYALSSAGH